MTSDLTRAVVDAAFDDTTWAAAVRDLGPEQAVAILKGVYADIGLQIHQRAAAMANTRDSDTVDDAEYAAARADYNDWQIRATTIRRTVKRRLAETQPAAQKLVDRHQADRRVLLRLAKRIWLWEQGHTIHGLDTALDDLDCSYGTGDRRPLRSVVEALAAGGEVLP